MYRINSYPTVIYINYKGGTMSSTCTRDRINNWIDEHYPDEEILLFDNLDDAFIGIGYQQYKGPVAIYDRDTCIEILTEEFREGCEPGEDPHETAEEFFQFNTEGAWMGETTPLIIQKFK